MHDLDNSCLLAVATDFWSWPLYSFLVYLKLIYFLIYTSAPHMAFGIYPGFSSLGSLAFQIVFPSQSIIHTEISSFLSFLWFGTSSIKEMSRGTVHQKEMKGIFRIHSGQNQSPNNIFNHAFCRGPYMKSQMPFILPPKYELNFLKL